MKKEISFPVIGKMSVTTLIGFLFGLAITVSWYITKNWLLNNLLGMFLAITFLKTIRLSTLVPGLVLLGLLFFYDIFWVFISP